MSAWHLAPVLMLLACGPPEAADIAPSPEAAGLPPPVLGPTSSFRGALAEAAPRAAAAEADNAALSARAAALRARAAGLAPPVLDPEARGRLRGATGE